MLKVEFSIALWVSNGYWMVLWQKKPFIKKYLSNNDSHFYSKYSQQGLACALLVELHIAVVFEEPQEGHSMLSALHPSAPLVNIEGQKTHTNIISLSSVGLINLRNVWIPLPTK